MDSLPYRFIGRTGDGLLIFQDEAYPSDAPQSYPSDEQLLGCASTDRLIDGAKYFAVSERQAQVRGFLHLVFRSSPS
jgi:hypothetical protein